MSFSTFLSSKTISLGRTASSKQEALKIAADIAIQSPALSEVSAEEVFHAFLNRENTLSTDLGRGVAIPHCQMPQAKDFVAGIVTFPQGISAWSDKSSLSTEEELGPAQHAPGDSSIQLLIFFVAPPQKSNVYIRLLSQISQMLLDQVFIETIVRETAPERVLCRFQPDCSCKQMPISGSCQHQLIHVFVQSEPLFAPIIQVMSSIDESSVLVVDTQYEGDYLRRIPLFANVWTSIDHDFSKLIIAVLPRERSPEILAGLASVCGDLQACDHAMVTVQNLLFAAGSLQL